MKTHLYSYRFAEEILQHVNYQDAWLELVEVFENAPLFVYPGKSKTNPNLDVVQQVMNTFFDRRLAVDFDWQYHPLATEIEESGLQADFRKSFGELSIQVEVQFGNMARWYSDIFKFQAAYSQRLIHMGISVVPINELARRIDSNIVNFERVLRELPSALLSITHPILVIGLDPDDQTKIVDLRKCKFADIGKITGRGAEMNRWRIVHAYLSGISMDQVSPNSPPGPMPT